MCYGNCTSPRRHRRGITAHTGIRHITIIRSDITGPAGTNLGRGGGTSIGHGSARRHDGDFASSTACVHGSGTTDHAERHLYYHRTRPRGNYRHVGLAVNITINEPARHHLTRRGPKPGRGGRDFHGTLGLGGTTVTSRAHGTVCTVSGTNVTMLTRALYITATATAGQLRATSGSRSYQINGPADITDPPGPTGLGGRDLPLGTARTGGHDGDLASSRHCVHGSAPT